MKSVLQRAGKDESLADSLPVEADGTVKDPIAFTTAFAKLIEKMGEMK